MIATNTVAPISHMLKSLIQKIREDVRMTAEFGEERDAKRADQAVIATTEQTLNEADTVLAPLSSEEARIQADPDTSDQGKVKRMIEAVSRTYDRLQFVGKKAKETRADSIAASEALKEVPKANGDVTVDALIGLEIRRILRGMVQSDRMAVFAEAVRMKNTGIERAVMNDPFFGLSPKPLEPLIPQDYIDRTRSEDAQATRTQAYRRMETLTFSAEKLEVLWGAIEATLGTYGKPPTFTPTPTRETDLKQHNPQAPPAKGAADKAPTTTPAFQ